MADDSQVPGQAARVSPEVASLRQLLRESDRIVVFTGAGISTESGIPDFRGPKGIWKSMTPIDFSDFVASEDARRESWSRKFSGEDLIAQAEPNAGHRAVTSLVKAGKVSYVITQNVDGLHQRSGTPDDQVIELHGNASYAKCLDCGKRFELAPIKQVFLASGTLPSCDACQGLVKTATISFGQAMPVAEMTLAETASGNCDLFLAIGSSLTVYPAAGLPALAKRQGAKLVILNAQPTDLDPVCDLVIQQQ
ncbi:MAG: SIR2 family NAD-dependent protein deacylase, partial [Pseudomonadales bacterium]